jgi:conjugal transfer pilus assembly protein TraW
MRALPLPFRTLAPLVLALLPLAAAADDLGTVGPTYEIRERHAIEMIQSKLRAMEKSGELAKLEAQTKARLEGAFRHPEPVPGLGKTQTARTYYYDPTVVLSQAIVDDKGNVLHPVGTRVNPLQVFSPTHHLLFFDGRDAEQVRFARRLIDHYEGRVKPVLTGGSPLDLMRDWKSRVYFDQFGMLVRRLGVERVPALVSKEGLRLRIDELKAKE